MDKPQKPASSQGNTGAVRTLPLGRPPTSATSSSTASLARADHPTLTASSSSENPNPPTPQRSTSSSKSSSGARPATPSSSQSGAWDPVSYRAGLEDDHSSSGPSSIEFWPRSDSDDTEDAKSGGPLKRAATNKKSSTAKFFRSILQKFGRSYNRRYDFLPNDKKEKDRNAKRNPKTAVKGVDIEPVRPPYTLPNCRFQVHDFTDEWHFEEKFDFIHMRMIGSLPSEEVFKSIYDNLNPGGWAEFTEWLVILQSPDHSTEGTLEKLGKTVFYPLDYKKMLLKQGFQEVHERKYAVPINTWPPGKQLEKIGAMMTTNFLTIIDVLSLPLFTGPLGWTQEALESLLVDVRKDVADTRIHSFMTL
ncbi:hypothetical protein F5B20DRAFT_575068 [Whalleya microplaca]|nr:hypothetical protein F5B20DRAFT_575068 [Whalleya microplaca]